MFDNTFLNRVYYKLACLLLLPLCALVTLVSGLLALRSPAQLDAPMQHVELPSHSAPLLPGNELGAPLRPLALTELEQRFARRFPGSLARMTDGTHTLVLRTVHEPTRMLHPAADCYRGLGYQIAAQHLLQDRQSRLWRCFEASRAAGPRLRVCERTVDAQGQGFTDTSAWYWAALAGQSTGPWQAITVATPL